MLAAPLAANPPCVTNLGDSSAANSGSLRACILAANALDNGQTINFDPSLSGGTIVVGSPLIVEGSMTIAGPGANLLTISGGNNTGVFLVDPLYTVTISGLTIANGNAGAGSGGGIYSSAMLTVSNCTFFGNTAQYGGAIFDNFEGVLTVNNSTFSGNTASGNSLGAGGGIYLSKGTYLFVTNSTFFGNSVDSSGGAIFAYEAFVQVNNSTISGNIAPNDGGGGILTGGGSGVSNSIVAGNTGGDCVVCGSQMANNLIGGAPQLSPLGWYGGATQTMLPLPGSPAIGTGMASTTDNPNIDQRGFARSTSGTVDLGAVQTNYLLVTNTQDVQDMSPDCTSGTGSTCSLRDTLPLASAGGTDIAFAPGVAGVITLTSKLPTIAGNLDLVGPGPNFLTVSGGGSSAVGSIFTLSSPNAAISGITVANGNSGPGGGIYSNAGTVTLSNSALSGNVARVTGGGIYNGGTLAVYNSTFSGNTAGVDGGGIYSFPGTVIVNSSTFIGNSASGAGGGIYDDTTNLAVNNSTFSGNTAPASEGGGIYINNGTLAVNNSILTADTGGECVGTGCPSNASNGNVVDATPAQPILSPPGWYGGPTQTMLPLFGSPASPAICAGSASLLSAGLTTDQRGFARTNLASGCLDAGAVQTNYLIVTTTSDVADTAPPPACDAAGDAPCSLRDAVTAANPLGADIAFAAGVTGNIPLNTVNAPLPDITGNLDLFGPGAASLTVSGGLSSSVGSIFTVDSGANAAISGLGIVYGNGNFGGGILNNGSLTVSNSAVFLNGAGGNGGGVFNSGGMLLNNSTVSGNTAGSDGGGIDNNAGTFILTNSTVSGNMAGVGAGLYNVTTAIATNSTVSNNTAEFLGGGVYNNNTVTLTNSIVAGNTADGTLGMDDCDSCGTESSFNLIGGAPQLATLGSYGGPTQTMLPLPGSLAICTGSAALDPAGLTTDERGFPRLNTSYTGFSASMPCLDLGADQTNYQSVQFTNAGNSGYSGIPGVAVSTPAAPVVSVTENGQNIGAVPVTLSFSGMPPSSVSGTGPVTTVAGTGATFNALTVSPGGNYTLEALLTITPSVSISATAALDIDSPATVTSLTSTASGTYTTTAMIDITVNFSKIVNVHGIPKLALNSGGTASYTSGTGSSSLLFSYNVASPQSTDALDASSTTALRLNGGSIHDSSSVAAILTLPTPGATGSLSANTTIVINTKQYQLATSVLPAGAGMVVANPTSTQNVTPALPTGTYLSGSQVQLSATANAGYTFSYWTEGIANSVNGANGTVVLTANPLTITINGRTAWTAHFIAQPTITKAFMPAAIVVGGTSTLSFSINNPNASQSLSGVFFRDNFPTGMQVAGVPNTTNTCGGTFTAPAGATAVHLNGGSLAGGASCSLSVSVKGTMAGMLNNTTGQIVSTNGGTGATSNTATLTVNNPIKLVQDASRDAGTTGSTSLIFPSSNTAGNFIAVVVRSGVANETITVRDSAGNMYLKAIQLAAGGSPGGENLSIYYAQNIAGGVNTVTVSQTTPGTLRIAIIEYSGVATSKALDQSKSAQGKSAAPNAGGVTTTTDGDLLLAGILTVDPEIYTPGPGYTAEAVIPGEPNTKLLVEQRIQTTAGPAGGGATLGSSDPWAAVLAAFHPASSQCVMPTTTVASVMGGEPVANPTCAFGPAR